MRDANVPSRRVVQGVDYDALGVTIDSSDPGNSLGVPNHHRNHEFLPMFPGMDVVNVYSRSIVPLKIYPGSAALTISVMPGDYEVDKTHKYYPGLVDDDISGQIPVTAGNYVSCLVFLDSATNLVGYLNGTEGVGMYPTEPDVPDGDIPLGYIRLHNGMTGVLTETEITNDPRPFISIATGSGGSGDMTKAVYDTNNDGIVNAADYAPTSDHGHTATGDGGPVEGSVIKSTGAATTKVLTADGSGNSNWEDAAGGSQVFPQTASMWHRDSLTNGYAMGEQSGIDGAFYEYAIQPSAADGNEFYQSFLLEAGTYTFHVLGVEDVDCPLLDWYLDNVLIVSGQDWYEVSQTTDATFNTASVIVTGSKRHLLKGVVNGKNEDSTGYWVRLVRYWFTPASYSES
jgi:hypothetical protein